MLSLICFHSVVLFCSFKITDCNDLQINNSNCNHGSVSANNSPALVNTNSKHNDKKDDDDDSNGGRNKDIAKFNEHYASTSNKQ